MAINWNTLRDDLAEEIAAQVAAATSQATAQLQVTSLGINATWPGGGGPTAVVTCPDTSQILVDNFVKASQGSAADDWYKVLSIVPNVSFTVEDTYGIGSYPTGGSPTNFSANYVWDGTNIVLTPNTTGIEPGDSIRYQSNPFFQVLAVVPNTSVQIAEGGGTIPSGGGAFQTQRANSSRTLTSLPPPPDPSGAIVDNVGVPFANSIFGNVAGLEYVLAQPHQLPSYTVGTVPAASAWTGAQIYVTNGAGGLPIVAFSDGSNWRRVDTRGVIST